MEIVPGGGAVTVTVITADFVGSATLVATTWYVPGQLAWYFPAESTLPPAFPSWIDHVTPVFEVPETLAENVTDPPATTVVLLVEVAIEIWAVKPPFETTLTVELPQPARDASNATMAMGTRHFMRRYSAKGRETIFGSV